MLLQVAKKDNLEIYMNSSDGTYLYLSEYNYEPSELDNKFKKDYSIWKAIYLNVNSYKVLI